MTGFTPLANRQKMRAPRLPKNTIGTAMKVNKHRKQVYALLSRVRGDDVTGKN
jgi:hypothetical protein